MALAVVTSGTTAALTIGVESTLSTQTPGTPTVFVVRVDGGPLQTGELLDVVVRTITLASGAERIEQAYQIAGGGQPEVVVSDPCPTDVSFKVSITQQNGVGRAIPWKILSL